MQFCIACQIFSMVTSTKTAIFNAKSMKAIWIFVRKFCFGRIDKLDLLMYNLHYI